MEVGGRIEKVGMIVGEYEMESVKMMCGGDGDNRMV